MSTTTEPKSILITGCSSGIGLCVADGLKKRGYRVFATARHQDDVNLLIKQGHESLQLDLDDSHSIQAAVTEILHRTDNRLYALFNNGAYGQPGAVEDLDRVTLRRQFETNVFGWHELTRLVLPSMRQQGYGRILQNSSVLGFVALKYRGAYNASKFAIEGLTDTLRLEFRNTDIHFSLIEPGPIESRFRANALKAFRKNIDPQASAHRDIYKALVDKLETEGPVVPFTLKADAVLDKVIHALEARRPKPRYYVTFPTYLFGYLKRILPIRAMDSILNKV
ncbi:MAG: SDR family oxidoreductase [Gammaproteobacteria bacterium]|nr:SDR family oxidoreductase [Gammaproteobacteria bacterium]